MKPVIKVVNLTCSNELSLRVLKMASLYLMCVMNGC